MNMREFAARLNELVTHNANDMNRAEVVTSLITVALAVFDALYMVRGGVEPCTEEQWVECCRLIYRKVRQAVNEGSN